MDSLGASILPTTGGLRTTDEKQMEMHCGKWAAELQAQGSIPGWSWELKVSNYLGWGVKLGVCLKLWAGPG